MEQLLKRTWAEIDLDALKHNYLTLKAHAGTGVVGVVKADAYGHGAIWVGRMLEELGAAYLAVSNLDEARELRQAGITMPILILGHTPEEYVPQLIENTTAFFSVDTLEYLQKGGRIGKVTATAGALLQIKPVLSFAEDGQLTSVAKVRGRKQVMQKLMELTAQCAEGHQRSPMVVPRRKWRCCVRSRSKHCPTMIISGRARSMEPSASILATVFWVLPCRH